jgi:hypothetical protein
LRIERYLDLDIAYFFLVSSIGDASSVIFGGTHSSSYSSMDYLMVKRASS